MPGPPPPSASYHLKLDSSSDSSDDEVPLSQLKARREEKLRMKRERRREEAERASPKQQQQQQQQQDKTSSQARGLGAKLDQAATLANSDGDNADAKGGAKTAGGAATGTGTGTETDEQQRRRQRIAEQVRLARLEQQNRQLERAIRRAERGSGTAVAAAAAAANGRVDDGNGDGGEALYLSGIERQLDEDDLDEEGNISTSRPPASKAKTVKTVKTGAPAPASTPASTPTPTSTAASSNSKGSSSSSSKKKKKKKNKKRGGGSSKKKAACTAGGGDIVGNNDNDDGDGEGEVHADATGTIKTSSDPALVGPSSSSKSKSDARSRSKSKSKSLAFSTVQVREYRRTMSTTTVPADGGWPLGLSDDVVRQYSAGTVDEFERRRQVELRERYVEVYERRRARLEKIQKRREEEFNGNGSGSGGAGRSRSGSKDYGHGGHGHGHGGGNRKRSGSDPGPVSTTANSASAAAAASNNASPSPRKRSHSLAVGSADVHIHPPPKDVVLETRPFDYKSSAKVLAHHKAVRRASLSAPGGSAVGNETSDDTLDNEAEITAAILDELDDGKNPLFAIRCEEERIHLILRDAQVGEEFENPPPTSPSRPRDADEPEKKKKQSDGSLASSPPASPTMSRRPRSNSTSDPYHYQPPSPSRKHTSSSVGTRRTRSASNASDPHYKPNDIYTHADVMHVRSELEKLRVDRNSDLGCTCRKLHVVLPNQTPTGRKHKHRRLTERKVKEELRKRGLMHGDVLKMKREELEVLLHDTVEKEGCCSNDSCPCVHNGIGCQADTCSCWEPGHDVVDDKKKGGEEATVEELWADPPEMQDRCGNRHGLYVVDFATIGRHRRARIAAGNGMKDVEDGSDGLLCLPVSES